MIVCNALNSSPLCLINLHTLDPIAFEILAVKTFSLLRLKAELLILFAKFNFGRELYYFFANFTLTILSMRRLCFIIVYKN